MTSVPQRWARVPPALAWKRPGLPTEWTRVLAQMPADMLYPLPPGYVLLEVRKDRPLAAGRSPGVPAFSPGRVFRLADSPPLEAHLLRAQLAIFQGPEVTPESRPVDILGFLSM